MKTKQSTFKKGQTVTWTSQASGFKKKKTGKIVAVILAGKSPKHRDVFWHSSRNHRSYIVDVDGGSIGRL